MQKLFLARQCCGNKRHLSGAKALSALCREVENAVLFLRLGLLSTLLRQQNGAFRKYC